MNIHDHFSKATLLPVHVKDVRDFILSKGVVKEIIQVPVDVDTSVLTGGFYLFRDLAPPYAEDADLIAKIAYPRSAQPKVHRLVVVKEMLHILDPGPARAATKPDVSKLIGDLILDEAREEVGLPAAYDHTQIIGALAILLPLAALDVLRPAFKRGEITDEAISDLAMVPLPYVKIALTDEWINVQKVLR